MVEELPDGIHSCLSRDGRRGVFAYYRHDDRHFWRFWDERARFVSDNRFEIHEIIRAAPSDPRNDEWLSADEQESALEAIASDILETIVQRRAASLLGEQVEKVQRDIGAIINSPYAGESRIIG